jgi:2-hydroxychromene-2-carboxylate isomerase|tara:strand:+ start:435 stop:998 length:564 start_codon:yes stop_codon:yes gene_type:complete
VEFFFDYASPYSYLADYQLSSFRNIEIIYRPMLLGAVMQATNNKPPGTIPSKGNYIAKDLKLWSQHYGIPFRMNSIFPQNTLKALRLAIVCQQDNCFQVIHQALFEAMFVHNLDLSDVDILKNLINQQQLNSDQLIEKLSENTIKDELKRNTNEAISRGAFGAPTFFINDEMFFGNDRLDFIKAKLL